MSLCGPSAQETAIQGQTQSLATTMAGDFSTRFASQNQVLSNLNNSLTPIVAAGPNQQGFTGEELASMNTSAINNAAAANRNAVQATGNAIAGQNGSGLESGIQQAIKGGIASNVANNFADTQNQIVQNNYATGRSNYKEGVAGMQALSGDYAPQTFGQEAQSGFNSAFGQADKINTQQQAVGKDILNAGLSIGGAFTGGLGNLDTT